MALTLAINTIDGNNFVNEANAAGGITITGTATDSVESRVVGALVTVTLNGKNYTGTVAADGTWSVVVGTADLAALTDAASYTVHATVTDSVGATANANHSVRIDETATLAIKPVDGNGFINATNTTKGITISGTSTGSIGSTDFAGQTVTVTLNGNIYTATIGNLGNWSVTVGAADLAVLTDGQTYTITASATDKAGNSASTTGSVTVDKTAAITINPVDGNNFINGANATSPITISGTASDSILADIVGQPVTVTLNGNDYTGTVAADGTWSITVGTADIAALKDGTKYAVKSTVTDAAGNKVSATESVTVDETASLTINPIDGNGFINKTNATNGITITGTSTGGTGTGDFAGETITVTLNAKTYTATIANAGHWSIAVGAADLAALTDGQSYAIAASATDKAGNAASTTASVTVDKSVTLSINPVDGNTFINGANAAAGIMITGSTSDTLLSSVVGRTVAVTLNAKTYTGAVAANGTWSATVGPADLAALTDGATHRAGWPTDWLQ